MYSRVGLIEALADEVVTVPDSDIARGILMLMERAKQVVEGAGAAAVAPFITAELDVSMFQTVLTYELSARNRIVQFRVRIDDHLGVLETIAGVASDYGANIRTINHYRADESLSVGEAYITFEMETSGREHAETIKRSIRDAGFEVTQTN